MEKEFDDIASGKTQWQTIIDDFYKPFHSNIVASKNMERNYEASQRDFGFHPATGEQITVRKGKFGFFAQIGEATEEKKPKYAKLKSDQLMETITLDEVLDLFKLPRTLGEFENEEVLVADGRFGPYIRHQGKFVSLTKADDPMEVTLERCIELIQEKRVKEANKLIKEFPENADVKVLNGQYGPYIAFGKKNVKIPKGTEPADITYAQAEEWAAATPEKKAGGARRGKK
jgi:DNA topoisomerase I